VNGGSVWTRLARRRVWVQLAATLLTNSYFTQQVTRGLPCLALNCYACPLAATACPIGAIQNLLGGRQIPLFVLGVIGLSGAVGGRFACGWLCPFGWLQELLYGLPVPKWRVRPRRRAPWWALAGVTAAYVAGGWGVHRVSGTATWPLGLYLTGGLVLYGLLGASRLFALLGLVVVMPLLLIEPWFCKLCPAGMLEGGVPQVLIDPALRGLIGPLYWLKLATLALFVAWMAITRRPFCRWICPLGTFWSAFNRWSAVRLHVDLETCIRCDRCQDVCPGCHEYLPFPLSHARINAVQTAYLDLQLQVQSDGCQRCCRVSFRNCSKSRRATFVVMALAVEKTAEAVTTNLTTPDY